MFLKVNARSDPLCWPAKLHVVELPSACYNLISTFLESSSLFTIELRSNICKYCNWMLIGVSFDLQKYLGIIDFFLNISSSHVLSLIFTFKSQYILKSQWYNLPSCYLICNLFSTDRMTILSLRCVSKKPYVGNLISKVKL